MNMTHFGVFFFGGGDSFFGFYSSEIVFHVGLGAEVILTAMGGDLLVTAGALPPSDTRGAPVERANATAAP